MKQPGTSAPSAGEHAVAWLECDPRIRALSERSTTDGDELRRKHGFNDHSHRYATRWAQPEAASYHALHGCGAHLFQKCA
jgi:hypothetical protein